MEIARPPVARQIPHVVEVHGDRLEDPYHWLRRKDDPEVIAHLEAENAYTDAVMKPTLAFQESLYGEMLARIKEDDQTVPYRRGEWLYYSRTEKGKQYPIYCRKRSADAPEDVTLDLNAMAEGHPYLSLGVYQVSDDGRRLAYSTDLTGFREYTLHVKDLETGATLPDRVEKVSSAAWSADGRTLYYVTEDHAKRPHKLWRHTLGDAKEKDVLVAEEKDELYRLYAGRSRSRAYIFVGSGSSDTSEWSYIPADKPTESPRLLLARQKGIEYDGEHHGNSFYIRINDKGRNFRLVSAPVSDPRKENWKEVVPHRDAVMLEGVSAFADFMVLHERENGLQKLRIMDAKTGKSHFLEFPDPVYTTGLGANREYKTNTLRYGYQSFTTPFSTYDYDVTARKSTLLKRQEVLGGFDPARYQSERIYATASDGKKIPVSLFYRKGTVRDGKSPMVLDGYGSYGAPRNVTFDSARLSLVDRGVVWAVAHIRGGGDLGKAWHDDGKMMRKKNTFTDFIAAAEHLVREKYTASDRLVIRGGSAGGLLLGAVVNMRPDLFKAAVNYVPFVDVINTMLDASLPLTVQEYLEWGNPNIKEEYLYMKSYSPYDNIKAQDYPAMLVRVSLNDSQVPYWEGAKYVAKLRATGTGTAPVILKTNMAAGHGGASGRYDALREAAFTYAFVLWQMGLAPAPSGTAGAR